jgi:flavodoxin I
MGKHCILVYASMTGNTEAMAEAIVEGLIRCGCHPEQLPMYKAHAVQLLDYDCIMIGSYTWGDGEVPEEALDFYDELDDISLEGKKAAVFGSCDSNYVEYGAAVDQFEQKLRDRGAEIIVPSLKVDRAPKSWDIEQCKKFGERFVFKTP